ncbi:hypothetical protein FACS189490_11460 [Clostridia bacterium]|nr:hypothetical protein FACS189490_11460 [Clostridia bacterium]
MIKHTCSKCGKELKLGDFAYDQSVCYPCFKNEVDTIIAQIESEERKDILTWMLSVVTERYGYEWRKL